MRKLLLLSIVAFGLLLSAGCCSNKSCSCKGDKDAKVCAETQCDQTCCDKGTCDGKCTKNTTECETCKKLMAGGTGWCEKCGKGFYEGKEVNCKGECAKNPGGPPCKNCVK